MKLEILQLDINNEKSLNVIYRDFNKKTFDFSLYSSVYKDNHFEHINPLTNEPFEESTLQLLEYIFTIFNIGEKPESYHGHSLSVSDIVKLDNRYFYCDGMDWIDITTDI